MDNKANDWSQAVFHSHFQSKYPLGEAEVLNTNFGDYLITLFKDAEPVCIARDGEPFTRFTVTCAENNAPPHLASSSLEIGKGFRFIETNDKLTLEVPGNCEELPKNTLRNLFNTHDTSQEKSGCAR